MNTTTTLARMEQDAETSEWLVIDRDGDIEGGYTDRSEAREACNELNERYTEEARLEERDELIDTIQGFASECDDLDTLRRIKLMLIQANR